jgi:hypothetical protein
VYKPPSRIPGSPVLDRILKEPGHTCYKMLLEHTSSRRDVKSLIS